MADPTVPASPDVNDPMDNPELGDPTNTDAPAVVPDVAPTDSRPYSGGAVDRQPPADLPSAS